MKVLTIYAHPADTITNCGGTLARHADVGDQVTALILTHGGRIHPNKYAEELRRDQPDDRLAAATVEQVAANKKGELERAADIIGIGELITLGHEDTGATVEADTIEEIAQIVAGVAPDIVICDYPLNNSMYNPHTTATQMALAGLGRASIYLKNLDGQPEFTVKQVFFTSLPVVGGDALSTNHVRNDCFVDITAVVGRKIAAMDCFASQGYDGPFARKLLESSNGEMGRAAGVNFAEAYVRLYRETYDLLPVTEQANREDVLTRHIEYSRVSIREQYPVSERNGSGRSGQLPMQQEINAS